MIRDRPESHPPLDRSPAARVLDLGCGDGDFLQLLRDRSGEVQWHWVWKSMNENITRGYRPWAEHYRAGYGQAGLGNFPDQSFDTVVMAHALQAVHYPDRVLEEMLRIGRQGIVTFPNFAHWRCRASTSVRAGRMPVSQVSCPTTWYDTPNIHFCTVRDFEALCRRARH